MLKIAKNNKLMQKNVRKKKSSSVLIQWIKYFETKQLLTWMGIAQQSKMENRSDLRRKLCRINLKADPVTHCKDTRKFWNKKFEWFYFFQIEIWIFQLSTPTQLYCKTFPFHLFKRVKKSSCQGNICFLRYWVPENSEEKWEALVLRQQTEMSSDDPCGLCGQWLMEHSSVHVC